MQVTMARRLSFVFLVCLIIFVASKDSDVPENEKWKKKDIRDYSEADVERLYDQWEEADEDELEEDELPEWKRPKPKIDLSDLNADDPESILKMSKRGQTLMMFATVSGNPTEAETQDISQLWQSGLFNANVDVQRYVVGADRVLFLLQDGSKAWEIKDFLVSQDRCHSITIEGKDYRGSGHPEGPEATPPEPEVNEKKKKEPLKSKKKKKETEKSKKKKTIKENDTKSDKRNRVEL